MKTTKPVDRERRLLLYLPTPAVRITVTCNNKKYTQTTVGFYFSFLVKSALGPPFFRFVSSAEPFFLFFFHFTFFSVLDGRQYVKGVADGWVFIVFAQLLEAGENGWVSRESGSEAGFGVQPCVGKESEEEGGFVWWGLEGSVLGEEEEQLRGEGLWQRGVRFWRPVCKGGNRAAVFGLSRYGWQREGKW